MGRAHERRSFEQKGLQRSGRVLDRQWERFSPPVTAWLRPRSERPAAVVHVPPAAPRDTAARTPAPPVHHLRRHGLDAVDHQGPALSPLPSLDSPLPADHQRGHPGRGRAPRTVPRGAAAHRRPATGRDHRGHQRPSQPRAGGRLQRGRTGPHLDLDAGGRQAQRAPDRRGDGVGRGHRARRQRHPLDHGNPGRAGEAIRRPPASVA